MKSVYKAIGVLALGVLTAVGSASRADAALLISIDPATQDVNIGDPVSVDIVASGITDPIGGFFFNISFSNAILTGDSYTIAPGGGLGLFDDFSFGFTGGTGSPLDLFVIADPLLDEAGLAAAQGASFILATVRFVAAANGLSPIRIEQFDISNWDGTSTLPAEASNGEVCVGRQIGPNVVAPDPCARVPEPGVFAMVGVGLAGLAVALRRRVTGTNA